MADPVMVQLERMRASAEPEVRKFVNWAATEFADHLTRDFQALGLPPMMARREAENVTRMVCRRVLGEARRFHQWGV